MTHSGAFVRSLLPWLAVLLVSASLAYTMNGAMVGGSGVQQPCAANVRAPMSAGVDSWVLAENRRAACAR